MGLRCVPLNHEWTGTTKLDLRAIYRRPNGDLTTALPLRRHHQWLNKGFEYVTLADAESLRLANGWLMSQGLNPQDFIAGVDGDGRYTPWKPETYLADVIAQKADDEADLKALISQYGVEAVEKITGKPVPARLKTVEAKKTTKATIQ